MKSNVSGRIVPQPGSSGCRPQHVYYNHPGVHHQSQQLHHHQHQHQNLAFHHHQQVQQQNYAMLQCFSQHSSNGWAGIPLISTAASSNRRQRKQQTTSTHRPPPPLSCNSLHIYNSGMDPHSNEFNAMSRLAMHAQGAPLLLTGSCNRNRMNGGGFRQMKALNSNQSEGFACKAGGQLSLHLKSKENSNTGAGGPATAQSEAAVACLPRIIKPRKRRKKDRKPLTPSSNFMKLDNEPEAVAARPKNSSTSFFEQQHHPVQMPGFEYETQCNLKNDESAVHVQQDQATGSVCFCRQCDPLSRIWAFPLRRSHSDNSSDTTAKFERTNKDVGVIGSNRSSHLNLIKSSTHTGSLSDSSDSGYGDILSGIHIGEDSFSSNYHLQLQKLPTDLLLGPTAESLLTESINEISRKLMETCDIKGSVASNASSSSSSSSSSDSCSVFSDSGLSSATSSNHPSPDELIFNFENLSINSTDHSNLLFPNNDSIFDCSSADINNNNISVPGDIGGGGSLRIDPQLFNCLDMLWGAQPPPLQEDSSKQPTTPSDPSSSSSPAFYRPTVASM